MTFGGGPFGRAFRLHTELVNGVCPSCHHLSIFIGMGPYLYKCTSCGKELEQKVNGVISYIPSVAQGGKLPKLDVIRDYDG